MQLVNEADGGGWTMSIDDRYGTMVFTMAGEAVAFAIFEVPLDARAGDGADGHFSFRRQANCSALELSAGKRSQRAEEGNPVQLLPMKRHLGNIGFRGMILRWIRLVEL